MIIRVRYEYLKPHNCVQIIYARQEYTISYNCMQTNDYY